MAQESSPLFAGTVAGTLRRPLGCALTLVARRIPKHRSPGLGWPLRGRALMTRIPLGRPLLGKTRLARTPLVALLIHTVLLSVASPERLFHLGIA